MSTQSEQQLKNGLNDVKSYLDNIHSKFPELFSNAKYIKVKKDIIKKILKACKITGLSCEEILKGLDFNRKDVTKEKMESFLAELRTIFWLRNLGFNSIIPEKQKNLQKNPDFSAEIENKKAAIEVFCLTVTHEQRKDKILNCYINWNDKFRRIFINKIKEKKIQLDTKLNADIKILVCVINSHPITRLNNCSDFLNNLEKIYTKSKLSKQYYLGVCTGLADDDCIYPVI